jgi:glycosyltransferase involved in cell wall biosynthesis
MSELHNNKGIDVALRGLSLLPNEIKENIIYSVAGNGEEKNNLDKLVSDLGITKMVRFLGFVPDSKKLLSGADIFLFPSRTENLPFAVLEAGLVGLPIVATSVGGVPEIIHDMQNGILVHSQNPKEIAEAILYLLDHREKQEEFGEEIQKTITNFFSLNKMLSETLKLYQ